MLFFRGFGGGQRRFVSNGGRTITPDARPDLSEPVGPNPAGPDLVREKVVVQGTLKTVTLRPRGGVPALEAELYDGTGSINVIWLGRRRISGIAPGRGIRVEGRIGRQEGEPIMFNPRYSLRPV